MTLDDLADGVTLRRAAKLLEAENQKMARMIAKLQKQLHELQGGDPEQLSLHLAGLEEQLAALRRRMFGESSEKRPLSPKSEPADTPKKQTGHGRREQPRLPHVEEIHLADEGDQVCKACGGRPTEWSGQYEESAEIDVLEVAPLEITFPAEGRSPGEIVPVQLRSHVTAIGTLKLEAVPRAPLVPDEAFAVELSVRSSTEAS